MEFPMLTRAVFQWSHRVKMRVIRGGWVHEGRRVMPGLPIRVATEKKAALLLASGQATLMHPNPSVERMASEIRQAMDRVFHRGQYGKDTTAK
jgi:hypothetical protein